MLQPMPVHTYLVGLLNATAQSLKELPRDGRCDRETWHRIMERLEPYCGDLPPALAEYDHDDPD